MNDNESAKIAPRTTPLYKTSPERIGLAIGCRNDDLWQTDFNSCKDVTWYYEDEEPPVSVCIGYVRADLYDYSRAEIERLIAKIEMQKLAADNKTSDMLKAMEDARRALAYAYKSDSVMEIAYLKLDAAIEASKGE